MKKFVFHYKWTYYNKKHRSDVAQKEFFLSIFQKDAEGVSVPKGTKSMVGEPYSMKSTTTKKVSKFVDIVAKDLKHALKLFSESEFQIVMNEYQEEFEYGTEANIWRFEGTSEEEKDLKKLIVLRFCYQGVLKFQNFDEDMILVEGGKFELKELRYNSYSFQEKMNFAEIKEVEVSSFKMRKHLLSVEEMCSLVKTEDTRNQENHYLREKHLADNEIGGSPLKSSPAFIISINTVRAIVEILNIRSGKNYRLPTEMEWQYAARAGKMDCPTLWAGSDDPDETCFHSGHPATKFTNPFDRVSMLKPNKLGIYHICGFPQLVSKMEVATPIENVYDRFMVCGGDPSKIAMNNTVYAKGGSWKNGGYCIRLVEDI